MPSENKICNVGWVLGGTWSVASCRLRGYRPAKCLSMSPGFRSRLILDDEDIEHYFSNLNGNDVLVFQRLWDNGVLGPVLDVCRELKIKSVMDVSDYYSKAVGMSHNVTAITVPRNERKEAFLKGGFKNNIFVVPDMMDYAGSIVKKTTRIASDTPSLVWFGTFRNVGVLKAVSEFGGTAITDSAVKGDLPKQWDFFQWEYHTFQDVLGKHDICLLPQTDNGKSGNKMISALAAGVPVIGSAIPGYFEIAEKLGLTNYLCYTDEPDEWREKIRLLDTESKRMAYMDRVRPQLEINYGDKNIIKHWEDFFREVMS
jgi:glycosyltransferase involved in cell wall biosynthesis